MRRIASFFLGGLALVVFISVAIHRTETTASQPITRTTIRGLQQVVAQECVDGTSMVKEYLGVAEAIQEIDNWYSTQSTDEICTEASDTKTTCFLNYTAAPALQDSCENVGAVYIEATSIFQCTTTDGKTLYYTSDSKPNCYDASCQSAEITALEDKESNLFMKSLIADTIDSCKRVRVEVSDPIYPSESGTAQESRNCQNETQATMSMLNDTESVTQKVVDAMQSTCTVKQNAQDSVWGNTKYQECQADFGQTSHSIGESCQSVNGLYFELDYSMACKHPSQDSMTVSVVADPLCASKAFCTLEQLDQLAANYTQRLFFTTTPSKWNCTLLDIQIIDFLTSASPTTTPAPSVSSPPSFAPTITAAPTKSPAPTVEANDGDCRKNSESLNATKSVQDILLALSTSNDVCQLKTTDESNSTIILRSLQSGQPCEVVEYDPSKDLVKGSNLQSICDEIGGLYVEEIFTIQCASSEDGTVQNEKRIRNKPACRYRKCNGGEMKEVLLEEMDWMRSSMEVENVVSCDIVNVQILARVGNIDGFLPDGSLPTGFQLSDECLEDSAHLETIIAIYNERQRIVKNFEAYTQVDMRQICVSVAPGVLNCYFDWEDFAATYSPINLETLCNKNVGQFLTGEFTTICSLAAEDKVMNMFSRNVPECLGLSCSTGEAMLYLMDLDDSWISQQFRDEGWECNTTVTSVFAPNYLTVEERANFTDAPTQAPDPTAPPSTVPPLPASTSEEGDESDPAQQPPSTTVPSPTTSESSAASSDGPNLSIGAIVGMVIAILGLCLCFIVLCYKRRHGSDRNYGSSKAKNRSSYDGVDFDDEMDENEDSSVYDWETNDKEAGDPSSGEFVDGEGFEDGTEPSDHGSESNGNEDETDSDEEDDEEGGWDDDSESSDEEEEGSSDDESVEYK